MRHRDDVDGLRAVAVVAVLVYHYHFAGFSGGFIGVDIFFVISGFVITGSVMADLQAGNFTIARFYSNRIRRIFPAFAAMILVTSVVAVIVLLPSDLMDFGRSVVSSSAFTSNLYFWKTSGYFAAEAQTEPLLHTWSLGVEEQYYLFAPIAFWMIYRFGGKRWSLFLVPLILLSFAAGVIAVFIGPTAGYFLLPTRMWELLLGAIIAFWNRPLPGKPWLREVMAGLGLVLIVYGVATLNEQDPFPGWNALFPCVGTALVIYAAIGRNEIAEMPRVNRLLAMRPVVWIGLISYSLYLVHWPVAAFSRYLRLSDPTLIDSILMMALSFALAWLSWRYIEQPFRHIRIVHRWKVLTTGVAVIATGAVIGTAAVVAEGLPQRFPNFTEQQIAGTDDWGGDECFNQNPTRPTPWNAEDCTRIHGDNGRILLWGDSFAAQYTPGILRDAKRIDADVLQYTFAGCPPILAYFSYARVGCSRFNQHALEIIREQHIDTVVLAGRWTDTPRRTLDQLGETVTKLKAMGLRVWVFGQSPEFVADVQHIDYISGSRMRPGKAHWTVFFDPAINERIARQAAGANYVDPLAYLCDGRVCDYRDGDTYFYSDYGHFSTDGSLRAVRAYFPSGVSHQAGIPPSDDHR